MISIYRKSFTTIRQYWSFFLLIAVGLEVASAVLDSRAQLGGELFIWYSFVYFLHRNFLLGEGPEVAFGSGKGGKPSGRRAFLWVSFCYFAVLFGLTLLLVVKLAAQIPDKDLIAFFVVLALIALNWVGLSIFGTAFPASAIGDSYGFAATLRRARSTGLGTAWRLLLGPGLFSAIGLAVFFIWPISHDLTPGLELADFQQPFSVLLIAKGLLGLALRLTGMVSSTLAVAILCNAYRRSLPPVDLPA